MLHWKELVQLPEDRLATCDVAETNLACAEGLPGAEQIDHAECIDRLNQYAWCISLYTQRRMPEFRSDPEVYRGSEAIFRVVCMVSLLQRQFGVRYHPDKRDGTTPFDTADTFIHGAIMGEGGTCASLPVVYAAVGRRLGYPLKLVACRRHLIVRWDEPGGERFNIEVNDTSIDDPPDDYYRQGLYETTPQQEKDYCYLASMTPRMELADFLAQRGHRWGQHGRLCQAAESLLWASALVPHNKAHAFCAKTALESWSRELGAAVPPGFPEFNVGFPARRRFPETLPRGVERQFLFLGALEGCLREGRHRPWWEALRRSGGQGPPDMPRSISIRLPSEERAATMAEPKRRYPPVPEPDPYDYVGGRIYWGESPPVKFGERWYLPSTGTWLKSLPPAYADLERREQQEF